ncbi:MAG: BatD family protein, partial [Verrucomicrobiota bacterium]|nr:BatD family protein [Verrucomicrobiota bacterium]
MPKAYPKFKYAFWSVLVWSLGLAFASGQQVYWSPSSGTLQQGKANRLQLHFEGCSPAGNVDLPYTPNVDFTRVGQSSSMNIFNSRVVQKLIVEYQVSPTAQGELTIPEFTVDTDQGTLNIPAAKFDVTEATVGNTGMRPEDIFKSELSAIEDSIYEGEIFTLRYVLGVRQDYQNRLNDISQPQWNPVGLVTKGFENHR